MIAKLAVSAANFAIDKPYSYRIPEGMQLAPGQRVTVPFGRGNRRCEAVVLALGQEDAENLKTVEQVLDDFIFLAYGGNIVSACNAEQIRQNTGKSLDMLFREVFRC